MDTVELIDGVVKRTRTTEETMQPSDVKEYIKVLRAEKKRNNLRNAEIDAEIATFLPYAPSA